MKMLKRISSLLMLMLVLAACMIPSAWAAEPTVVEPNASIEFTGKEGKFAFAPGSDYSKTDLFPNLKNAFPGDILVQQITVTNTASDMYGVELSMRAVPHNQDNLPQAPVLENEGTVENMNDFLSQLGMIVWLGTDIDAEPIYIDTPDQPDGLRDFVSLGQFMEGDSKVLTVALKVPLELGNEYMGRLGEVDWEFKVDEIPEPEVPETGDTTNVGLLCAVAVISLAAVILLVVLFRRKNAKKD